MQYEIRRVRGRVNTLDNENVVLTQTVDKDFICLIHLALQTHVFLD